MRSVTAVVAGIAALALVAISSADPGTPKFWVQGPTQPQTLLDLTSDDPRIHPIIRINVPWIGTTADYNWLLQNCGICGTPACIDTTDPEVAAKIVACAAKFLTQGRQPIPGVNGAPSNYMLGIMIAGFGEGGEEHAPYYQFAPALAKPREPGNLHDYVPGECYPWATPWYTEGPADCSNWLFQFGQEFSSIMANFSNPLPPSGISPDPANYQPLRLIFDIESGLQNCCDPCVFNEAYPGMIGDRSQGHAGADSRYEDANFKILGAATQNPTTGAFDGPFAMFTGPTLSEMFDAWATFCPTCPGSSQEVRNWLGSVSAQAQNAALDRAVRSQDGLPPAVSGFNLSGTAPKYSNYAFLTTDQGQDPSKPPYNLNGGSLARYTYADGPYHRAGFNHADFHSPVCYSYVRNRPLAPGQTPADWTIQDMRERMDSLLFSAGSAPIFGDPPPAEWITPWVAGLNLYFVNGDFHRRLLSLLRSKGVANSETTEFNVFVDREACTHDQLMANWTKFRHIIDQVYGFDIGTASGANSVTMGSAPAGAGWDRLAVSDFRAISVKSATQGAPLFGPMAQITTSFNVGRALTVVPGRYTSTATADSKLLRVNVEVVVEYAGANVGMAGPDADHDFSVSAAIWNDIKQGFFTVPLTRVCHDAFSPPNPTVFSDGGIRAIFTGVIPNTKRVGGPASECESQFVHWDPSAPTGTLKAQITVAGVSTGAFTAHFDLLQIIGVDANESDLDWNHDDVVNDSDLFQFICDFAGFYIYNGSQPIPSAFGLLGFDANNDGVMNLDDLCAFRDALRRGGYLSGDVQTPFDALQLQLLGVSCDDQPVGGPPHGGPP